MINLKPFNKQISNYYYTNYLNATIETKEKKRKKHYADFNKFIKM